MTSLQFWFWKDSVLLMRISKTRSLSRFYPAPLTPHVVSILTKLLTSLSGFRPMKFKLSWLPPKFSMVSWESSVVELRLLLLPANVLFLLSCQLLGLPAATSPLSSALLSLFCFSLLTLSRAGISGSSVSTERNVGMLRPLCTTNDSSEPRRRLSSLYSEASVCWLCCNEFDFFRGWWLGVLATKSRRILESHTKLAEKRCSGQWWELSKKNYSKAVLSVKKQSHPVIFHKPKLC